MGNSTKTVQQTCSICGNKTFVPEDMVIMVTHNVSGSRAKFGYGGCCEKCKAVYCCDHLRWLVDASFSESEKIFTARCPICGEYVGGMVLRPQWRVLHQLALGLKEKGNDLGALAVMERALNNLASREVSSAAPSNTTVSLLCNLSSIGVTIGEWRGDTSSFQGAISAADRGLEMIEKLDIKPEFDRAALWHNRGHAGLRLGEIAHNRDMLGRASEDLAKAGEVFKAQQDSEALSENAALFDKAQTALKGLG